VAATPRPSRPARCQVIGSIVRDASRSKAFHKQLGFEVREDRETFVVLTWEGHELFLDKRSDLPEALAVPQAVLVPIGDREYYNNAVLDGNLDPHARADALEAMQVAYAAASVDQVAAWCTRG
jgi:catechol 2,3-dioxygenase-like lactoylglutathione lyase family enzyme